MIQFIKDSLREMKHVVWPTRKETTQHFYLVVVLLIAFGGYLFLFSTIFSNTMFALKDMFGKTVSPWVNTNSSLSDEEIDALFSQEATIDTQEKNLSWSGETSAKTSENSNSETSSGSQE